MDEISELEWQAQFRPPTGGTVAEVLARKAVMPDLAELAGPRRRRPQRMPVPSNVSSWSWRTGQRVTCSARSAGAGPGWRNYRMRPWT